MCEQNRLARGREIPHTPADDDRVLEENDAALVCDKLRLVVDVLLAYRPKDKKAEVLNQLLQQSSDSRAALSTSSEYAGGAAADYVAES